MARTVVTPELIKEMNELYLKIGTYAGVSKALGGTPSATTVKKYIIPNYISEEEVLKKRKVFTQDMLSEEFDVRMFEVENWGGLCELSTEEREAMKELWEELAM